MRPKSGLLSCILVVGGLLLSACDSGGSDNPTNVEGNGTLAVQMTDASTDLVSSVNVYVKAVTVKPRGRAEVRIANDVGMVDVLKLKGTVRELVAASVAASDYDYVRIDFDQARSNVVVKATGTTAPLLMSKESVQIDGGFTVRESSRTTVTLDFKADESLELMSDGSWLLVAVIVQIDVQIGT